MNYLSHHRVARAAVPDAAPEFYVGNVLPDLLGTSGEARLRTRSVQSQSGELARGARLHLATDKLFHGHAAFRDASAEASALLREAPFSEPPPRLFFLAHVFVEVALDGVLAEEDISHVDHFYAQFADCDLTTVVEQTGQWVGAEGPLLGLAVTLKRFMDAAYLYSYETPEGRAEALARVCQRAGLQFGISAEDKAVAATAFARFAPMVAPRVVDLLALPDASLWYNSTD
jgi:hypothetical protein